MGNKFKIYAYVHAPAKGIVRVIHMNSFGVHKGVDELSAAGETPDGRLTELVAQFNHMKRPSPMTFTWTPADAKEKNFFRKISKEELIIELTASNKNYDTGGGAAFMLYFGDAKMTRMPYRDRKGERIDLHFKKFRPPF